MDILIEESASYHTVLRQLSERYDEKLFYTWAGPTLVAINPLSDVPHLYGPKKVAELKLEDKKNSKPSPHIYRIAERSVKCMTWNNRSQAIIVNGDSGAGKTYSARHLLQYLATVESSNQNHITKLEDRLCWSNPILESFGNAQTIRNANSSRFGKLVQLNYSKGKLATGQIKSYLLEQTRVSSQAEGERNFHIFYQVTSGLTTEEKTALRIDRSFKILKDNAKKYDAADYVQTRQAFRELGFQDQDFSRILKVLAILLNLGNVEFLENSDGTWSVDEEKEEWQAVCELASVDGDSLSSCLTIRTISAGTLDKRAGVFYKPCESEGECVSRRDCLMRMIYSTLFLWLVGELNKKLSDTDLVTDNMIGILDVYGFESMTTNSLEQLCINYANERLQSFFVQNFLKHQKLSLLDEGVDVSEVATVNNNSVIGLLDGPVSVFGVLNEECRMKRYPTDEQLVSRVNQATAPASVKSSPLPKRAKRASDTEFRVQHYAGEVTYDAKGLLEKNSDQVPVEMIHLLSNSSDSFIRSLFGPSASSSPTSKAERKHTVLAKFKNSVDTLLNMLNSCEVHYIRCVKPHEEMEPGPVDPVYLLRKLNECGVMDTVRLASLGLPVRVPFDDFFARFRCLTSTSSASIIDYRDFAATLIELLQSSDASINSSQVKIGKKRIFMSERVSEYLETLRTGVRNKAGLVIGRAWQRFKLKKKTRAAMTIQRCWARFRARRRWEAAVRIQAVYRCWRARVEYGRILQAVETIQKTTRGWCARRRYREMREKGLQDSLLLDSFSSHKSPTDDANFDIDQCADDFTNSSGVISPWEHSSDNSLNEFVTIRKRKSTEVERLAKDSDPKVSPRAIAVVSPFRNECFSSTRLNNTSLDRTGLNDVDAFTDSKPHVSTFVSFNSSALPLSSFSKSWHWKRGIFSIRRVTEVSVSFISKKKCLSFAENLPASEFPRGLLDILD